MATFGQYEVDRPEYRTGFSAIYPVGSAQAGAGQRVLKAYQPSVRVRDERLAAIQTQAFLDGAAAQQEAARHDPEHWAPIHEFGTASSGPFYVTDRYDFSVRQLVDGHVRLGAAGIHNIASSITKGLLALKQARGRPHGNLKLTNILIARHGDMSKARVVLCDPLPDCHLDPDTHARADLRRLGELIHHLAMRRSAPLIAGYQVPDSEHWQKLGKQGDALRHICNRLLQVDVEPEPITLEDLADQLAAVAPRRSRRALVGSLALTITVLCAVVARLSCSPPLNPDEAVKAYDECCRAASWLGPLRDAIHRDWPERKELRRSAWGAEDPSFKRLADRVDYYAKSFLRDDLPSREDVFNEKRLRREVGKADAAREHIENLLLRSEDPGYWPWLTDLGRCADRLAAVGCQEMTDFLITQVIPRDPPDETLVSCVDKALDLKRDWPKEAISFDRLELSTLGQDSRLTGEVAGVREFLDRLSLLPNHYRLSKEEQDALEKERDVLLGMVEELIKRLQDPNAPDNPKAGELLRQLTGHNDHLRAIQPPHTKGNRDTIAELRQKIEQTEPQVTNRSKWYEDTREKARNGISTSSELNGWYESYVESQLTRDRILKADKSFDEFDTLRKEVERTRDNFKRLADGFGSIKKGLAAYYYALDETPPWAKDTIESLYQKCKNSEIFRDVSKDEPYRQALGDLDDRVTKLKDIRSSDIDVARKEAMDVWSRIEVVYAAWLRLGAKDPPGWPSTAEQWQQEQQIQARLRKELPTRARSRWQDELRQKFDEIAQVRANTRIGGLIEEIRQRAAGVPLLEKFDQVRPKQGADPNELGAFVKWANALLNELQTPDWPGRYDLEVFAKEAAPVWDPSVLSREAVESWRSEAGKYHVWSECPWKDDDLSGTVEGLKNKIEQGYRDSKGDPKAQNDLKGDEGRRLQFKGEIEEIARLPAIKKHEGRVRRWNELQNELADLEKAVEGHTWPPEYALVRPNDQGDLDFQIPSDRLQLNPNLASFRPARLDGASFIPMKAANRKELDVNLFKPIAVGKETLQFPEFVQARKDNSVVLRLVEGNSGGDAGCFYLSLRETTNRQYASFLTDPTTRSPLKDDLPAIKFVKKGDGDHPARSRILRPSFAIEPSYDGLPVTWVTATGAEEYARWLGGSLPREDQYNGASTSSASDATDSHVRSSAWANRAESYNASLEKIPPEVIPLGVAGKSEQLLGSGRLDPKACFSGPDKYGVWPRSTDVGPRNRICDLTGNVWEWCLRGRDLVLYGGSCLSPPELTKATSVYTPGPVGTTHCDVGFRVALPITSTRAP